MQEQLDQLPEGKLICAHGRNCFKWYVSDGKHKTYLPKKERAFAEQLAFKKYLSLQLQDLLCQKKALEAYLKQDFSKMGAAERLLKEHSGYQELLHSHFKPKSQTYSEWAARPYECNTSYPEHLIHKTSAGFSVRSKSESMITHFLYSHQIPFRYECALHLGTATIYPDFTILHPTTGETYYWEHFGKMDDPIYANNACSKLQLYQSYQIIPTIRLIITYETKQSPLCYEQIEMIAKYYFL